MSVDKLLTIHQHGELERKLAEKRPLRIKYGIDPTAAHVHFGHAVGLLALRRFQREGHIPVIIIGDYTARIGDPTGRDQTRPQLGAEDIGKNSREYLKQVGKIIDLSKAEVRNNGGWFGDMNFLDVIKLVSRTTVGQLLERNDFDKRLKTNNPIFLHECLYPVMQAYDSVMVRADVELGGTEQLFNLMLARDFQREAGQDPQVCATVPILRGLDGKRRMGKSLDNYVGLDESPHEMYAKIMSIPDVLIYEWWSLLPVEDGNVPLCQGSCEADGMEAKKQLAGRLVRFFHGETDAADAWHKRFSLKEDPDTIPEVVVHGEGTMWVCKLLTETGLAKSNNEARRFIAPRWPQIGGSGVTVGSERKRINEPTENVQLTDGLIVRVGSRKIVKVRLTT